MILSDYSFSRPRLVLKLNHGLPERSLSAEIHFLNCLLEQFSIDFMKVNHDLNAKILNTLVVLSKYDQGICNYFYALIIELHLIAQHDGEMLQEQLKDA